MPDEYGRILKRMSTLPSLRRATGLPASVLPRAAVPARSGPTPSTARFLGRRGWVVCLAIAAVTLVLPGRGAASAQLEDPCTAPAPDAEPGTPEWDVRDALNMVCGEQRLLDALAHPMLATPTSMPVGDPYRDPVRHDGSRFRFFSTTVANGRGDDLAVEVYRPCAAGTCQGLPEELDTFEPPYPAVVVQHGGYQARKELYWWATQTLAEAGYMTVSLNAVHDDDMFFEDVGAVLDWLTATPQNPVADGSYDPFWQDLDPDRIGMAGHSGGGATSNRIGHTDDRIKAIVGWDRSGRYDLPEDLTIPSLYLVADHGFTPVRRSQPPNPNGFDGEPAPDSKWADFDQVRAQNIDTIKIALRAATHLDWVPMVVAASRYGEAVSAYYTLAWFDRYLKAPGDHDMTQDAFRRLTATHFDGSADRHNISQGFYDPPQAALAADPYGGNVPYRLEGMPVADRLSFYFLSKCFLTVPQEQPGDPVQRVASEDLRVTGCSAESNQRSIFVP